MRTEVAAAWDHCQTHVDNDGLKCLCIERAWVWVQYWLPAQSHSPKLVALPPCQCPAVVSSSKATNQHAIRRHLGLLPKQAQEEPQGWKDSSVDKMFAQKHEDLS